jgi:uncharacterized protein
MADAALRVTVACSPGPRSVWEKEILVSPGTTAEQALAQSGVLTAFPGLEVAPGSVGIWGEKVALQQALRDGDRVEIYRALKVDPKVARRERFRKQGSRGTGLFARTRGEAKKVS